ncbi:Aldo/keto reductase [Coprinopsis marcescibilis]|uniref:Aldo/keto reductase n=1 Tax=Coprinopsis marcescibilis TaxID=230819 RepID=A0A5C3KTM5_COPMA|nr:Aldo/keto reductase [Coprinopsis marcescibilis]
MAETLSFTSTVRLSSGYDIPLLGFGVYLNGKDPILEAFKVGYRHVDTAQMYGNEAEVGEAVAQSGLKREDIFITTKINSPNHGFERASQSIDESLAELKLDYVDLFLVHDPLSGKEQRLETWKALIAAKAAGKIRTIGVSNYGKHHIEEIKAAGLELPSVNQIELHPFCQHKNLVQYCKDNGIILQAYCPIVRGDLSHPVFKALAKKYNRDTAQILLRWSLQKGFVPLPKSSTPSRIQSNAQLYDFELAKEDEETLDALDKGEGGAGSISWNPVVAP